MFKAFLTIVAGKPFLQIIVSIDSTRFIGR